MGLNTTHQVDDRIARWITTEAQADAVGRRQFLPIRAVLERGFNEILPVELAEPGRMYEV